MSCVLIETLWNVKMVLIPLILVEWSINRNIVECKVLVFLRSVHHQTVLIETLWNVKIDCRAV